MALYEGQCHIEQHQMQIAMVSITLPGLDQIGYKRLKARKRCFFFCFFFVVVVVVVVFFYKVCKTTHIYLDLENLTQQLYQDDQPELP